MTKQGFKTVSVSQATVDLLKKFGESRNEHSASSDKLIYVAVLEALERGRFNWEIQKLQSQQQHQIALEDSKFNHDLASKQFEAEMKIREVDRLQSARDREDRTILMALAHWEEKAKQSPEDHIAKLMTMQLSQSLLGNRMLSPPYGSDLIKHLMTMELLESTKPKLNCVGVECSYSTNNEQEFVEHVDTGKHEDVSWVEKGAFCPICVVADCEKLYEWKSFSDWRGHVLTHKKKDDTK